MPLLLCLWKLPLSFQNSSLPTRCKLHSWIFCGSVFQVWLLEQERVPICVPPRNYSTNTFTPFSERSLVCLSRYASHSITFTIVKCTVQWFSVYSQGREFNIYCCLLQEHFHYPVRKSLTH